MTATQNAPTRHRELGAFLRAHRERLPPAALGLARGSRRRTPGLRREEVAELSGVSVTWYTWIEQGREVSVSVTALANLARTLQLSTTERGYLFELAGKTDPGAGAAEAVTVEVPAVLRQVIEALTVPAYVLDRYWNACAWNGAAAILLRPWLQGCERNLLRFVFLDPAAAMLIPDRDHRALRILAEFRIDYGRHLDDPAMTALVAALIAASPAFADAWHAHAVLDREGGERQLRGADGRLHRLCQVPLDAVAQPGLRVVALVPA